MNDKPRMKAFAIKPDIGRLFGRHREAVAGVLRQYLHLPSGETVTLLQRNFLQGKVKPSFGANESFSEAKCNFHQNGHRAGCSTPSALRDTEFSTAPGRYASPGVSKGSTPSVFTEEFKGYRSTDWHPQEAPPNAGRPLLSASGSLSYPR